jgi:phage baseplate assembly protein gpV
MATVRLSIDGSPPPSALAASVESIIVRQLFNAPAQACINFADPPQGSNHLPRIGQALDVTAPDGAQLFTGEITVIETVLDSGNSRSLCVRAYDRLHRLRKQQAVRAMPDAGLKALLKIAASEAGLGSIIVGEDPPGRPLTIQGEESTAELLVAAAEASGRYFYLRDGAIHLMTLAGDGAQSIRLNAGGNLLQARAETNAEAMRASTVARGWEHSMSALVEAKAGLAAQDAVEFRAVGLDQFVGLGERQLVGRFATDREEALALAQADLDRATALTATFAGLVEGDAGLRPGRVVSVTGLSSETDGDYVLTEAEHRFDSCAGYVTRISTEPPPTSRRLGPGGATIARVTSTDDPQKLARVKAQLTAYGAVETGWMPVLSIGGGKDKGISVMPEPDDDVLVLLPDGDAARGIVLGGLYGATKPPGRRPGKGARSFTIRTPAGQELTLNGAGSLVRLRSAGGDLLEMSPDGTKLHSTRDLTIEAPGRTITFGAAKVDFRTA